MRELTEKVLAALRKGGGHWWRRSRACGGLDGAQEAPAGRVVLVPLRTESLGPPFPPAPCREPALRRGTGTGPRASTDSALRGGRPDAANPARPSGGRSQPRSRRRGGCGPTERHGCRRARRRDLRSSEVLVDGPLAGPPRAATDAPTLPPGLGPLPKGPSVPGEREGGVLRAQTPPRIVPPRAKPRDAATRGRVAHYREEGRATRASPGRSGGVLKYRT